MTILRGRFNSNPGNPVISMLLKIAVFGINLAAYWVRNSFHRRRVK